MIQPSGILETKEFLLHEMTIWLGGIDIYKSSLQLRHFQTWQLGFEKAAVYEKSPMDTYGLLYVCLWF